jgi:hypothetical protein
MWDMNVNEMGRKLRVAGDEAAFITNALDPNDLMVKDGFAWFRGFGKTRLMELMILCHWPSMVPVTAETMDELKAMQIPCGELGVLYGP